MLPIILASTSPRRLELMRKLRLPFKAVDSGYIENMQLKLKPIALAKYLSNGKAEAVAQRYPKHIIIAADTLVACAGKVLGKPKTETEARKMLRLISGRAVSVITGLTVINTKVGKKYSQVVAHKVIMDKISTRQINNYIATGEPMDKAGAFAVQGVGAVLVKRIEGDFHNIMGLPLYELAQILKEFNIQVL